MCGRWEAGALGRQHCNVFWGASTVAHFARKVRGGEGWGERPERAASSEPRATPWVSVYKRLRPVRAKVWANGWLLLLPLQGVGYGDMAPRALPWARDLLPFQGARGEGCGDSIVAHFARKVRGAKVAAIARAENPTRSCPRALVMFATCSWPSLCEQSELQCWRRIVHNIFQTSSRHIRGPHFASKVSYSASPQSLAAKKFVNSFNSLLRRLRPPIKFVVMLRPNKFRCILCPPASAHKKGCPVQDTLFNSFYIITLKLRWPTVAM